MNRKNITKTVIHLIIVATRLALVTTRYTLGTTLILLWLNVQELYNCKMIEVQTHTPTHTHTHTHTHRVKVRERQRDFEHYKHRFLER
jgi:hypothetical protein